MISDGQVFGWSVADQYYVIWCGPVWHAFIFSIDEQYICSVDFNMPRMYLPLQWCTQLTSQSSSHAHWDRQWPQLKYTNRYSMVKYKMVLSVPFRQYVLHSFVVGCHVIFMLCFWVSSFHWFQVLNRYCKFTLMGVSY